jgi:hypothetical protein
MYTPSLPTTVATVTRSSEEMRSVLALVSGIRVNKTTLVQRGIRVNGRDGIRVNRDGIRVNRAAVDRAGIRVNRDGIRVNRDGIRVNRACADRAGIRVNRDGIRVNRDGIRVNRAA